MRRWLLAGVITLGMALCLAAAFWFFWLYPVFYRPSVMAAEEPHILYIPTGAGFGELTDQLVRQGILRDQVRFETAAARMGYPDRVKPGRYCIQPGWNNRQLVGHLRSGNQEAVRVVINNLRLREELAGRLAAKLEPDSLAFLDALYRLREYVPDIPLGEDSTLCLFIPNTYEMWWNSSPADLLERMWKEQRRFWNETRLAQAEALGLSPTAVYILASIVEKETLVAGEKSRIAGVYLNRLRLGMPLQADPTVVFALRAFDKERILYRDLDVDSPYNTYRYAGLPPGPICMPEISTIDAVLQPESHDYLYFCARPDNSGAHAFAKTLAAHNENARRFQQWLNTRGVFR
jgi:UPF0755 protein